MKSLQKIYPNDTVAIVAPSKWVDRETLDYGIKVLQRWSLNVLLGKHLYNKYNYFAGTDEQRQEDLQWAINHPEIKAIFCARGGYGASRIVDNIDFSPLEKYSKCLIGFSDITALHLKLNQLEFASLHANMPALFMEKASKRSISTLKDFLFSHTINYQWTTKKDSNSKNINNIIGTCNGLLIGGNLSMIGHCLDTMKASDFENKILFIEDVGEKYYVIDRYIIQLLRSNKLNQLKGVIVGAFNECEDHATYPFIFEPYESIFHHFSSLKIPVAFNFPAGHIDDNCAIPFGINLKLTVEKIKSTLVIDSLSI